MAQKITVALEDELDGGLADETVRSGIGGAQYGSAESSASPGVDLGIHRRGQPALVAVVAAVMVVRAI